MTHEKAPGGSHPPNRERRPGSAPARGDRGGRAPLKGERRKPSHREGRKRYVAFVITGKPLDRRDLVDLINAASAGRCKPWLTFYENGNAVIRCIETERAAVIEAINGMSRIEPAIMAKTLVTSGTIRKAKEAFAGP